MGPTRVYMEHILIQGYHISFLAHCDKMEFIHEYALFHFKTSFEMKIRIFNPTLLETVYLVSVLRLNS